MRTAMVQFLVEFNSTSPDPETLCEFEELVTAESVTLGFQWRMVSRGHLCTFTAGNANAWANHFNHPDFGGDSLNWVDNVDMVHFSGHGSDEGCILLASNNNSCASFFRDWKLGVKRLRWLVLDCCHAVTGADKDEVRKSVIGTWGGPAQGVHLIFAFIGNEFPSFAIGRGDRFASAISDGVALANAWLDAAFSRSGNDVNRPIAIAFGANRDDAIHRRESETLDWRDVGPVASDWLAWKWRD